MELMKLNLQYFTTPVQPVDGTFGPAGTSNTIHYTDTDRDTDARFGKLLEPGLRKIFFETYDELPEQFSMVYNVYNSEKAKETDWGMGAFQDWTVRADQFDTVAYQTLSPGLERTYIHDAFTSGFMITKEMYDDDLYGPMEKLAKALARSGRAKVEKDAIKTFVNAFTEDAGGVGASQIYDGKALCASDHPLLDSAGVGNNLASGALSDTNIKAAIQLMLDTPDEAGNLMQIMADRLIIPPALLDTAKRVLHSTQISGGDLNDTNEYLANYGIQPVVMSWLSTAGGGNDLYWFLQDSKRHEVNFFWRKRPEFAWDEDFDTFVAKYRAYMRYSFGVSDWRGIVGSPGV